MPRKISDNSQPSNVFDLRPPDDLRDDAIIEIASEFSIQDSHDFISYFQNWAAIYRNNKVRFREGATTVQRRESSKRIRDKCAELIQMLQETGVDTIRNLQHFDEESMRHDFSEPEIQLLFDSGIVSRELKSREHDIGETFLRLRLLKVISASVVDRAEEILEKVGNTNPISDMDRRILIINLRQFITEKLGRKFSRKFDDGEDPDKEDASRLIKPDNWCSKFVVRCAQLIDPDLSIDMIDRAMKDNIAHHVSPDIK